MSARDEHARTVTQITGGHVIIPKTGRYVHGFFGGAPELVEHIFESLQPRLVRLRILCREDMGERSAELGDVIMYLCVIRVGKNHQGDFLGDLG